MFKLAIQKTHIKPLAISITNLYCLSLAWLVSGHIAFVGPIDSYLIIFSILLVNIPVVFVSCILQRRTPINIYLDLEFVMISKFSLALSILLTVILFAGSRADNGIDLTEISTLVFSLISMIYVMATMFKINHGDRWYSKVMKEENSKL